MQTNRVYVIPEAKVGDERKTVVMRSQWGASLALGISKDVTAAYEVEARNCSHQELYTAVTKVVKRSKLTELEASLQEFCDVFSMSVTKLVPTQA